MRIIKYFFEALIIYLFFFIIKLLGLNLSKKIFSFLFRHIGPIIKSKKIIDENFKNFSVNISNIEKNLIISNMWSNYGKTFVEYIF